MTEPLAVVPVASTEVGAGVEPVVEPMVELEHPVRPRQITAPAVVRTVATRASTTALSH
jgi:hypothetical protein